MNNKHYMEKLNESLKMVESDSTEFKSQLKTTFREMARDILKDELGDNEEFDIDKFLDSDDEISGLEDFDMGDEVELDLDEPLEESGHKKLVKKMSDGNVDVKVYKEDGEYCVKVFKDGEYHEDADYYTDDKDDAMDTAKDMLRSNLEEDSPELGISGDEKKIGDAEKDLLTDIDEIESEESDADLDDMDVSDDEMLDMEVSGDETGDDDEAVEDRVDDLESAYEELENRFKELEQELHDEDEGEELEESTELHKAPEPVKKEPGSTMKKSPSLSEPRVKLDGEPVENKGSDVKGDYKRETAPSYKTVNKTGNQKKSAKDALKSEKPKETEAEVKKGQ